MAVTPTPLNAAIEAAKEAARKKAEASRILTQDEISAKLMEIPSLVETEDDDVEHLIIYGNPGTGKTLLAGLMAEWYNILWFDGDKGLRTLYKNLPPEMLKRIRMVRIPDNTMSPQFVSTMLKVVTGRQINICVEHGAVQCLVCNPKPDAKQITVAIGMLPKNWIVVMDSLTQFVASAMAITYYKINPTQVGKDVDDHWRGTGDDVFAYWGGLKNIMDKFGNYVKDLSCNFITISHEAMVKKEDKLDTMAPVAGSDNSSKAYAKYFGTEIHAKIENNKYKYISTGIYSNQEQAKSRSNIALEKEEIPSLIHVFNPAQAKELLAGSFNEWYLKRDITKPAPKPKEIIAS